MVLAGVVMTLIIVPAGYQREYFDQFGSSRIWWDRQCQAVYDETQQLIDEKREKENRRNSNDSTIPSGWRQFVGKWIFVYPTIKQHGWPRPFLVRSLPLVADGGIPVYPTSPRRIEPFEYVSWTHAANWPLFATTWRIHPGNLLLCIVVWVGVVAGAGATTEWWVRSRGGLFRFRFRLADLLALATVVALGVGWWSHHSRAKQLETRIVERLHRPRAPASLHSEYVGPVWLARLVGDHHSLPHLWHITRANYLWWSAWKGDFEQIVHFPYLRKLEISHVDSEESEWFNQLDKLAGLNLQGLDLEMPDLIVEDIEQVLDTVSVEHLVLQNPMMTEAEVDKLREKHPNVDIEISWYLPFRQDSEQAERVIAEARSRRGFD